MDYQEKYPEPEFDIEYEMWHSEYNEYEEQSEFYDMPPPPEIMYFKERIVILASGELFSCRFIVFEDGSKEFTSWGLDHTPWDGSIPF